MCTLQPKAANEDKTSHSIYAVSPQQLTERNFDLCAPLRLEELGNYVYPQLIDRGSGPVPVTTPREVPRGSSFRIDGKPVRKDGFGEKLTYILKEDFLKLLLPRRRAKGFADVIFAIGCAPSGTCLILFWEEKDTDLSFLDDTGKKKRKK